MKRFIVEGPGQLVEGFEACKLLELDGRTFNRAVLLGMGGSALSGGVIDLLRHVQGCRWPWHVVRDYHIPVKLDSQTLVFALSYSGNTEETLATLDEAAASGAFVVGVSAGGKLEQIAAARSIAWLPVPPKPAQFQPRFALYFMFAVVYEVLCRAGLLDAVEPLPELADRLKAVDLADEGREIAGWLGPRFPVIYTPTEYEGGVARIWKIKFNENAKIPGLAGAIPETNHNELIAFPRDFGDRFAFLLMPDEDGDRRVVQRFDLFGKLMRQYGYPVRILPMSGPNPLAKCLASLKLADWVTYYAALERGIDPVSIPAIQDFKKML